MRTFCIALMLSLMLACNSKSPNINADTQIETDSIKNQKPKIENRLYGILVDSFYIDHGEIEANVNLSKLFNEYGITPSQIHQISEKSKSIFDVRKIKAGNDYVAFLTNDSFAQLQYFIYEINAVDYVVYDLRDTINIYRGQKNVTTRTSMGSGTIETSLWNSMIANSLPPTLALDLSDIYAWSIDFFGLEKGDTYRFVFDEDFIDSVRVGIKNIHYAKFVHKGHTYYAIPFEQDSVISFFDENGNSLRKAFLKAPLKYSRISSHFSNRRMHPVLRIVRPHHGVDYAAPLGTPVMSIGDGVVVKKGYAGGAGNMVKIKHNGIYTTAYLHLSRYGEGVNVGAHVRQGQVIGYVGSTGTSTGPHLDFRVYKNGSPINPLTIEAPPVEPIHEWNREAFNHIRDSILSILEKGDALFINTDI